MLTANELHRRGVEAINTGRYARARQLLQRASERAGDGPLHGLIEASLAYVEAETGHPGSAMDRCEIALAAPGLDDHTRARLLGQRGLLHMLAGSSDAARVDLSATIATMHCPEDVLGRALLNRGCLYLDRNEPALAVKDFVEGIPRLEAAGLEVEAAMCRHNLGYARYLVGELVAALADMAAARPVLAPLSPVSAATGDQDRAEVLLAAGLVEEGRAALLDTARSWGLRRLRRRQGEAESALARTYIDDDPAIAYRLARIARRRFEAAGVDTLTCRAELIALAAELARGTAHSRQLLSADGLAAALEAQGLRWPAVAARLFASRVAARAGDPVESERRLRRIRVAGAPLDIRLLSADVRAELAAAQGRRAVAFKHVRWGLQDLHAWQSSFGSLDLQTNVAGHGRRLGVRGLELAVASRRPATLFEWSERARMLASRVQPVRAPQNPEIVDGLAELRGELTAAREAELRTRIRELAWQHAGSREVMDPVSLAELRQALAADTALVAYVVVADQVVALVVTSESAAWHDLGSRQELEELLSGLLPDLDMAASELPDGLGPVVRGGLIARIDRLAGLLVTPLVGDLGDRSVVLTPSGVLAGLPWTLLPGLAGRPVTVAQSATSWLARGATPLRTASAGFVAGPRVARAEDEVTAAAKEWPNAVLLTNSAATAEAVSALAATVDVLHVAAHGQHSAENPLFSGLQLADGLWFGYDIDQLDAVPDVVLLSACEVGRSSVRWGEELIGMATAWLHAGARCVIASPAAVADQAAYDALVAVHRGLAGGQAPAAALAAAIPAAVADRPPVPFLCFG